jgi:N-hydroxyarylamine O-acetyltransferase
MSASTLLDRDRLSRYFARIGYTGPWDPSASVLAAIHHAHLLTIPYENLDIHLGRPITLDRDAGFAKLVDGRRGGWCYEMNGLLGRVLESLGFDVRYVAGAVGRAAHGEYALDNHLVIIVTLDRPWIVDVGFGDGFMEPLPLEPGTYRQGFLEFHVTRDGDWWRVHNHAFGGADGFDFTLAPRTIDSFAAMCHHLQTSPESSFVKATVCERVTPDGLVILRSASLRRITAAGVTNEVIPDAPAFARVLRESFGLDFPAAEIDVLWPKTWASYVQWQAEQAAS